jgi:hypothetical protein
MPAHSLAHVRGIGDEMRLCCFCSTTPGRRFRTLPAQPANQQGATRSIRRHSGALQIRRVPLISNVSLSANTVGGEPLASVGCFGRAPGVCFTTKLVSRFTFQVTTPGGRVHPSCPIQDLAVAHRVPERGSSTLCVPHSGGRRQGGGYG